MVIQTVFRIVFLTLVLSLTSTAVDAQTESSGSKDWEFHVVPYLWLYGINGDATVKGVEAEVDVSFSDLLENLDFAGMIHMEAHNGTWGAYINPIYGKLSADGEIGPIDLDVETEMAIIEFGGSIGRANGPWEMVNIEGFSWISSWEAGTGHWKMSSIRLAQSYQENRMMTGST